MSTAWGAASVADEVRVRGRGGAAARRRRGAVARVWGVTLACFACSGAPQGPDDMADAEWGGDAGDAGETQNGSVPARRRAELAGDAAVREAKAPRVLQCVQQFDGYFAHQRLCEDRAVCDF